MSTLSLNLDQTVPEALSAQLRHPFWPAAMRALLAPVKKINEDLVALEAEIEELLSYNGQTMVLERMLNLKYYGSWSNTSANPIYITTQPSIPRVYFYEASELLDVIFEETADDTPVFFFDESDYTASIAKFTVFVPSTLIFDQAQMRGLIERYRLAGKTFTIQSY